MNRNNQTLRNKLNGFVYLWLIFAGIVPGAKDAYGQFIQSQSVPLVLNYSRNDYGGSHQVWDIEQDSLGYVYFATIEALVEYDGRRWMNHPVSSLTNLRCLTMHNGLLYSGGVGSFGFWQRKADNSLVYVPVLDQTNDERELIDEIWRLHSYRGKLYAQSFERIYVYDGQQMNQIQAPGNFQFSFVVGNRFFVQDKVYGLYELIDDHLELRIPKADLGDGEVWGMVQLGEPYILVATYDGRLFRYSDKSLEQWHNQSSDFLAKHNIFCMEKLDDQHVALGTILSGTLIMNSQGEPVQLINKTKGLKNNTVLSMHYDAQHNLWLGLDNGIAFVNTNSPYTYQLDTDGKIGAVYTSMLHRGVFYIGTNQGLLSAPYDSLLAPLRTGAFRFHSGTQGQVWSLDAHADRVLCGHDKGVFEIHDGVRKISSKNGVWLFREWPHNDSIIICGTYNGFLVLKAKENGEIYEYARPDGFTESSRFMEIDRYDNIWVSHPQKGLYRVRLSNDFKRVVEKEFYGTKTSFGTKIDNYVLTFEGEVVFSTPKGFYNYDVIKNDFSPHTKLNQLFDPRHQIHRMLSVGENTWYSHDLFVGFLERQGNNYFKHEDEFASSVSNYIPNFSNIFMLNDSTFSLASYEGLTLLHYSANSRHDTLFAPQIRKLRAISSKDTLLLDLSFDKIEIPYTHNFLQVEFSAPNYGREEPVIMYRIDDSEWKLARNLPIMISNLPSGNYTFKIRLQYGADKFVESNPLHIRIMHPWYFQPWAWLLWLLLAALVGGIMRLVYRRRLRREKSRLEESKLHELKIQQEHYENEALKNQQKIMMLEKEQLESEVRFKSKELANMVINNIDKNEVLQRIKAELKRVQEESSQKLPRKYYQQLIELIDQNLSTEDDWNVFEMNFNKAYEGFFKKLKAAHPSLTPNDLRLCAYLRMNLSSKEVAPLLSISVRSVEVSRYRLRKKLELDHDANLIDYMLSI